MEYKGYRIFAECAKTEKWSIDEKWRLLNFEHEYDWTKFISYRAMWIDVDWQEYDLFYHEIMELDEIKEAIDKYIEENKD